MNRPSTQTRSLVPLENRHQDDLLSIAERYGCSEVHVITDSETGLKAIIAIHSTKLGPATGGCRCLPYPSFATAMEDAANLARGMSYKSALAGIPAGGGKAVLMRPDKIVDRTAYFESFGRFVDSLGGKYVTAVDSGTGTQDMDNIGKYTDHVRGLSVENGGSGNPSPFTARGVRKAIEVAVSEVLERDSLEGVHVAIQGVGHVGSALASQLHERGAKLTVTDHNAENLERCHDEFNASTVTLDDIFDVECDVFAPCALGGVLNDNTVRRLQTRIIAGAANNQLAENNHGMLLHQRGIIYLPDYVINSGGLIHVLNQDPQVREQQLNSMLHTLRDLFKKSSQSGIPMYRQADIMAGEILGIKADS